MLKIAIDMCMWIIIPMQNCEMKFVLFFKVQQFLILFLFKLKLIGKMSKVRGNNVLCEIICAHIPFYLRKMLPYINKSAVWTWCASLSQT